MIRSAFFLLRLLAAWAMIFLIAAAIWSSLPFIGYFELPIVLACGITAALVVSGVFSHVNRVRLIAGRIDGNTLANRQRRQIEIPFEAGEAFDLLDAAIRELPNVEQVHSARDSLQVSAKVARPNPYGDYALGRWNPLEWLGTPRNQLLATVTPEHDSGSVTLICEPESPAWTDLFRVDDGTNLENAEAIARAITRRVAERRRSERAAAVQTVTEKELTQAKLSLLHAQVEPHFLYNTLASAQLLTRQDPQRADEMLGHLIDYLRHSLPRTQDDPSTLGDELERAVAYLEILKVRMGSRLDVQLDVPQELLATPLPTMMLQTLVENAIKHGLEPRSGGGTVWIRARRNEGDGNVAITVADDGEGLAGIGGGSTGTGTGTGTGSGTSTSASTGKTSGTGIGLRNVRERLQLLYGGQASLAVAGNFPSGVAATITVPAAGPAGAAGAAMAGGARRG